jgi:hypothetical protein
LGRTHAGITSLRTRNLRLKLGMRSGIPCRQRSELIALGTAGGGGGGAGEGCGTICEGGDAKKVRLRKTSPRWAPLRESGTHSVRSYE